MTEALESGNRRAEISGNMVSFLRVTGNVRRSVSGVWFCEVESRKRARYLARRWVDKGKLGDPVLRS